MTLIVCNASGNKTMNMFIPDRRRMNNNLGKKLIEPYQDISSPKIL